jgi:hypothetical protein
MFETYSDEWYQFDCTRGLRITKSNNPDFGFIGCWLIRMSDSQSGSEFCLKWLLQVRAKTNGNFYPTRTFSRWLYKQWLKDRKRPQPGHTGFLLKCQECTEVGHSDSGNNWRSLTHLRHCDFLLDTVFTY